MIFEKSVRKSKKQYWRLFVLTLLRHISAAYYVRISFTLDGTRSEELSVDGLAECSGSLYFDLVLLLTPGFARKEFLLGISGVSQSSSDNFKFKLQHTFTSRFHHVHVARLTCKVQKYMHW